MAKKRFHETCPFHELTLFNARFFSRIFNHWTATACQHKIVDLALSLIFFDGVINEEEITLAVEALQIGKIYSDGDEYFVDVASPKLGRRRVVLSTKTLFILHQYQHDLDDSKQVNVSALISIQLEQLLKLNRLQIGFATPSLQLLCGIAQDFYAMQVHGPLREWMQGTLRARTLRVEAMARHTFNKPELMQFEQRQLRRPRFVGNDLFLRELLDEAVDNSKYGGSGLLRIKRIRDQLSIAQRDFLLVTDQVAAKFVLFLCDQGSINAPGTIKNHYLNARDFIHFSASKVSTYGEFVSLDWAKQVSAFFDINPRKREKEVAINLLLKMLGVRLIASNNDAQNDETKRPIQPYADFLSDDEIERLESLVESSNLPHSTKNDTLMMLRVLNDAPMRREDIATLRLCDVVNQPESPHIVISSQTTGTKKSVNAIRVLALSQEVMSGLNQLSETKQAVFNDPNTGLFSGLDNPKSFDGGFEILAVLSQGMKAVSGAADLTPHHFRSGVMTKKIKQILSVENALHANFDELRMALFEAFVFSGHGDLRTLFEHYVCDLEWLRREWVDHLGSLHFIPSAIFLSTMSGLNQETLRKYANNEAKLNDFLKRQLQAIQLSFQHRIVFIRDLLAQDVDHYPFFDAASEVEMDDRQLRLVRHRILCLCGVNSGNSADLLHLAQAEAAANDHAFDLLSLASQSNWRSSILASEVLTAAHIPKLLQKLGTLSLSSAQLVGIAQKLPTRIGEPWALDIKSFELFPDDFFSRINQAGFEAVFCFSRGIRQSEIETVLARLLPKHHERQNLRNFANGTNAKIKFVFRGDARPTWPRRSQQATAWVTLFLLGFFVVQFEEDVCQKSF